jgi:hypothetical protein
MPKQAELKAVGDDVPMVDNKVAVGADLEFQRKWWKFERYVWIFFSLVLIADLSGALGRGPLANAEGRTADGMLRVKYERVERANTASIMTILPQASAVKNGKLKLYVSDSVLKAFGAQRVIPEPEVSAVGGGGVTYTFAATEVPMTIQIELKPSFIGMHAFRIAVAGGQPMDAKAFVLP